MAEPTNSNYVGGAALDNDTSLGGSVLNLKQFTLDAGINGIVTTISVAEDITAVNVPVYLLIDNELVWAENKSAGDFTSCTRGAGGTTAAAHLNGAAVYHTYAANYFNQLKRAIIATQTELGTLPKGSFGDVKTRLLVMQNAPDGTMFNGKLSVTVASNNLTVSIKTLAGADPSSTGPVYVRINGTIRILTVALSVTKNAGTNWCNAGGSELATKEVDYFAYLIWNTTPATDILDIGFSRIPYGRVYSDFSGTSTNEKYLAQGNGSAPTATDDVVNIGRFAATLSAGAGYTWTVPSFTNVNLIQHPIYETRWLTWQPVYTGFSANPTFSTIYKIVGNILFSSIYATASGTSNATTFTMTWPFVAAIDFYGAIAFAIDNGAQVAPGHWTIPSGSRIVTLNRSAGTGWTASGDKQAYLSGFYEF